MTTANLLVPTLRPSDAAGAARSRSWDEVNAFCRATYMPYHVRPLERGSQPAAVMLSRRAGRVKASRFAYGTGVHLRDFDPEAGNILVLTTLKGAVDHHHDANPATTVAGDSFVADCARTDYWLNAAPDHLQFNLTIPHSLMEDTARKWYGFVPGNALWTRRLKFGGEGSRWRALLGYVGHTIGGPASLAPDSVSGRHLEEMICLNLLQEWAAGAGISLESGARAAAPRYVRQAEEILTAEAREAPSIGEVAHRVGVSARTLSEGFRRFRGLTPRDFLSDRRLEGLHADLLAGGSGQTVLAIASGWGFSNMGALAGAYRARFGELPSQTLSRR
ncbi:AraC family transcriptional regulator [Paracoccus jiaweipingae]|uniref:AraC family transcriptional regulator n=1 Tax=unclassified Paracoccus (in: a-proteobacteria) TaxID=2688777 RepID=UPI0037936C1F